MVGSLKLLITISALLFFASCVTEQKKTTCGANEAVNVTLRTCVPASALGTNNRPTGIDQLETTAEDVALSFTINSGSDIDGDTLNYLIVTSPSHGTVTNCMNKGGSTGLTDRTCTYTPNSNFYGTDTFTYKINDGFQDSSTNITVTVTVSAVNDAPTINLQSPVILEDTATIYTFSYTDPESNIATTCTAAGSGNMSVGACSCDAVGVCRVTVTPDANENSSYATPHLFSVNLTLTAGALSSTYVEYFTVTPVNDRPVITPVVLTGTTLAQNAALSTIITTQPSFTDNDTTGDLPAQTHTWALTSSNTCSWISIDSSTGALSGTPGDSHVGTCTLQYNVTDNLGYNDNVTTTTQTLTITNVAPVLTFANALTVPVEDTGSQLIGTVSSATACGTANFCLTVDDLVNGTLAVDTATSTCDDNGTITLQTTSDPDIKNIYFQPNPYYASQAATCNLVLTFTDRSGTGLSSSATGTFTIQEINNIPTFSSTISNQSINETTALAHSLITIDEGGGTDEDGQSIDILITSSNTTLVPHSLTNIKVFTDSSYSTLYSAGALGGGGVQYNDDSAADNGSPFYLYIQPAAGQTGTSTITITLTDNGTTNGALAALAARQKTISFVLTVTNKAAVHNDWTEIYATGAKVLSTGTISSRPSVRLKWNAFTAYNTSISAYKVYRSTSSTGPFTTVVTGCESVSTTSRTCTDSTLGSSTVASTDAGSIYYYRVKAIASDSSIVDTNSTYSTARVPVPYNNMALVSRRIANKEACTLLSSTSDKLNYNRCTYTGAGDTTTGGINYYDVGSDYFVDQFEASCNYTVSGTDCTETGGSGCIGDGTPAAVGVTVASSEAIYYNRATGDCYFTDDTGVSWNAISALTTSNLSNFVTLNQTLQDGSSNTVKSTFPQKPPIVNIQQHKSHLYCTSGDNSLVHSGTVSKSLMNRKIHIASSAWSTSTTNQGSLEEGANLSLTSSSCNSSYGGNLDFQDGLISALMDTWTATETSAATFSYVMAGSTATSSCISRYGIQDLIGNVEEWNLERMWSETTLRKTVFAAGTGYRIIETYEPFIYNNSGSTMLFNAGSTLNTNFKLLDGYGSLTNIFLPMGIPTSTATTALSSASFNDNNDYINFSSNSTSTDADGAIDAGEIVGITSGGNFADQTGAGRYSMRFRSVCKDGDDANFDGDYSDGGDTAPDGTCDVAASGTEENLYTGFRCMIVAP